MTILLLTNQFLGAGTEIDAQECTHLGDPTGNFTEFNVERKNHVGHQSTQFNTKKSSVII